MSGFRIRLQTLIQGVLLASLLIVTCIAGFLIYRSVLNVIQEGFDKKLFAVSSTSASFVDGDVHQAILAQKPSEDSQMYLQYVGPMRRILHKANCKYVYSQIVGPTSDPKQDITYVLDATVGPDHSHIGDLDHVPQEEKVGCHGVQSGRMPFYISSMHSWTEWGLLKSCFTPIYDHTGKVVAMMGTDVNVSIVLQKTNSMLAQVGIVSLICIFVGALLAIRVSRRLTRPIAVVKDGALVVAAGQYGHRIEINEPMELADLAGSFNKLSTALAGTVEELSNASREQEQRRRTQELEKLLADTIGDNSAGHGLAAGRVGTGNTVGSSSGYAFSGDRKLLAAWRAEPSGDPLENARLRAEIADIAERLLRRYAGNPSEIASELASLYPTLTSVIVLDSTAGIVRSHVRRATPAVVVDHNGGKATTIDLASTPEFALKTGHSLLVGPVDPERYVEMLIKSLPNGASAEAVIARIAGESESHSTEEIVTVLVAS
jgi:HAMP domain-containing protein